MLVGYHDGSDLVLRFTVQHLQVVDNLCPFIQLIEFIECYCESLVLVQPFTEFGEEFVYRFSFSWCRVSELDQEFGQ
jgi:hypothetical protein